MTQVAATEFARNFGRYREEAQRGFIPPKFYDTVMRLLELAAARRIAEVPRD